MVVSHSGSYVKVDVGLKETVECQGNYRVGERVTLQLIEVRKELGGQIVEASRMSTYWGYQVVRSKFKLASMLETEHFNLKIGTSRYGTPVEGLVGGQSIAEEC